MNSGIGHLVGGAEWALGHLSCGDFGKVSGLGGNRYRIGPIGNLPEFFPTLDYLPNRIGDIFGGCQW